MLTAQGSVVFDVAVYDNGRQRRNSSELSYEELYRNAYNLVLNKRGNDLFHMVYTTVYQHANATKLAIEQAPLVRCG